MAGTTLSVKRSTLDSVFAVLRQLAAVASVVLGALGTGQLPHTVRAALVLVGGAILTAEHARKKGTTTAGNTTSVTSTSSVTRSN